MSNMKTFSLVSLIASALACTNMIVTRGASADGSTMISYNADSGYLFGTLYHYPAADHKEGEMRDIYDWDSGVYLGQIPEVSHTYNVVGNINEHGVMIGETTFGGVGALQHQTGAIMDYGSLIWVSLQRSKTAREAITIIGELMSTYGYASEGESFSVGDENEVWIMEMIGKGNYEKGAVWVALKVPDGYITGHANQARIQTFPLNDPENCMYSPDVISFARSIGLYSSDKPDSEFSFSDVYDAMTFSGARACEARVWSMFSQVLGDEFAAEYLDYAQGYNLTHRMPLWVEATNKISAGDMMGYMRSHYDGTWLDMAGNEFTDVGAGYSHSPYRWRPLSWQYEGALYYNERPIGTQQTGWNFVAQSRQNMPQGFAGLLWFGVDDSTTTVRFPIYGSATRVPATFGGQGSQDGVTSPMLEFSMDNAFSVFNLVANWAYTRWNDIYPDVLTKINEMENNYFEKIQSMDEEVRRISRVAGPEAAVEYGTVQSAGLGDSLVAEWGKFFGQIFMKFRDGFTVVPNANEASCGCAIAETKYSNEWYGRIVSETGKHYLDPNSVTTTDTLKSLPEHLQPVKKESLRSLR